MAIFLEPNCFEISEDEQRGARRSPVGRVKETPLVWQGERDTAIVGIIRWWKGEGSLMGELSSDPEMMVYGDVVFREEPLPL